MIALDIAPGDLASCNESLRVGSKSFHAASKLLPQRVRAPTAALYAFCRSVDDAIDDGADPRRALDVWRGRLERAYGDTALDSAVDRAFSRVARTFAIPRCVPEALLEGMEWDANGRRYETESDLLAYGARVASTVGVMMTLVMGHKEPDVIARACDLGVAMQITNICRDVGEDARHGRVYLPAEWLRAEGIDPDALRGTPTFDARLGRVVERALARAATLYARADIGISRLPGDCRFAMRAARSMYADIGRTITRAGFDSVTRRAVVSTPRKLWLLGGALFPRFTSPALLGAPPLPEAAFLVDAVTGGA